MSDYAYKAPYDEGYADGEEMAGKRIAELEAENQRLLETLHQIYGEACQLLNSEDDVDVWAFVKLARDKALEG